MRLADAVKRADAAETYADPRRWWILAACCCVAFAQLSEPYLWMIGLEIPSSAFGKAWRGYRIFANLGVVLFVAFQLVGGVLGDLIGRRRIFLIGAVGAIVANMLSLLTVGLVDLIITRALAGLMGALVFPLTVGLIRLLFAGDERTRALLIYTFVTSVGTLAALLGIPLESWFGWRATLVLPIIMGALGTVLAWRYLPESRALGGLGRSEAVTAAAWTLVFLALIFGLVVARTSGTLFNPITLAAGVVGILGILVTTAWTRYAARKGLFQSTSLMPRQSTSLVPRHFLSMLLLVSATLSFGLSGYVLQLYMFFSTVQQQSGFISGLALAPVVVGNLFTLRWAARFAIERPRYVVVGGGLLAMAAAMLFSSLARPNTPYLFLVPIMILFGLGFLVASASWVTFFFSVLPADLIGLSSGINRAAGLVGTAMAGVALSTVLEVTGVADFKLRLADLGLDAGQKELALQAVDLALRSGIGRQELAEAPGSLITLGLLAAYRESFSVGVSAALLTAGGVCAACGALAWIWLRYVSKPTAQLDPAALPVEGAVRE